MSEYYHKTAIKEKIKKETMILELTVKARSWVFGFLLPIRFLTPFTTSFACLQKHQPISNIM